MNNRRTVTRLWSLIAAALLAVSTFAAPATTETAQAQTACDPSFLVDGFTGWSVLYDDRGVSMCIGEGSGTELAYVQIVDLAAGAKVRVISDDVDPLQDPSGNNQYNKRQATDWFNWIQFNTPNPTGDRLFSTTNASFFTDTTGSTTELSLPETSLQHYPDCPVDGAPGACDFQTLTFGRAMVDNTDPAWDALKRSLVVGNHIPTPQDVRIRNFPTHYSAMGIFEAFSQPVHFPDGTVAFDPSEGSGTALRTFAGINSAGTEFYILTTIFPFQLDDAQAILDSFGSSVEIQLDGGGSTQMYAQAPGGIVVADQTSIVSRPVPDVLAVYLSLD